MAKCSAQEPGIHSGTLSQNNNLGKKTRIGCNKVTAQVRMNKE